MELSPKQQTVEQIKKAQRILILGHKKPEGDFLGSALAFAEALAKIGKKVELAISDNVPETFSFLPFQKSIKNDFKHTDGKIIRIDTAKVPVKSMKWQKDEEHLDVILETDKNLKFEFIEIINGQPKPDLIIVLDTSDVEKIDLIYDKNTELFFEVPIINIDHHSGNDYFGTVNLVDLTATSTAEILVSLFEALGIKIADPDTATCLLTGIIAETQSFRTQNTTPKSLTVAAQLLAAGARQQEIISNLYKKKPMALLKLWGEMLSRLQEDKSHKFAWTKVAITDLRNGLTPEDAFDASEELLSNTPDADVILILCEVENGKVQGQLKAQKGSDVLAIAKLFGGDGIPTSAKFTIRDLSISDAELKVLKKIHDSWADKGEVDTTKQVWDTLSVISDQRSEIGNEKGEEATLAKLVPQNDKAEETAEINLPTDVVEEEAKVFEAEPAKPEEADPAPQIEEPKPAELPEIVIKQPSTDFEFPIIKPTMKKAEFATEMATNEDPIDSALHSIEEEERKGSSAFASIGEVMAQKKKELFKDNQEEIDVFDEED